MRHARPEVAVWGEMTYCSQIDPVRQPLPFQIPMSEEADP